MGSTAFLDGFSIGGYRSFREPAVFGPLGRMAFLVGVNNSGKSNVLRYLSTSMRSVLESAGGKLPNKTFEALDSHRPTGVAAVQEFGFAISPDRYAEFLQEGIDQLQSEMSNAALKLVSSGSDDAAPVWLVFRTGSGNRTDFALPRADQDLRHSFSDKYDLGFWPALEKLDHPSALRFGQFLRGKLISSIPPIHLISPVRGVGVGPTTPGLADLPEAVRPSAADMSGQGLPNRLAALANPTHTDLELSDAQFSSINRMLGELFGDPQRDRAVRVPQTGGDVLLLDVGLPMPIANQGKGLEDILVFATSCLLKEKQIICLEEPEAHLHPSLQRKLVDYLSEHTTNQYIIATHSAHILEGPDRTVISLENRDGSSTASTIATSADRWDLVNRLGYQASDLMVARCVIWVEGHSDATYLREWLKLENPDLEDGVDYAFLHFNGAGHLRHLSADTPGALRMLAVNRRTAFVIDSDLSSADDKPPESIAKITDDLEKAGVHVWVTSGREIENYVRLEGESASQILSWVPLERFEKMSKRHKPAKAEAAVEHGLTLEDALDLKARVKALAEFIAGQDQ